MTTFTTDDREEAYKKIVEAAPNQPGYEDAVPIPPVDRTSKERSLAGEITEGFEALERIRQLQEHNAELKEYNTELHGIEHDLEMKLSKLQAERDQLFKAHSVEMTRADTLQAEIEALRNQLWDLKSEPWGFDRHPVKELTDEEIEGWIVAWAKDLYGTLYVEPTDHQRTMAIKMARAILRKAQENG